MAHEYITVSELKSTLTLTGESFADPDLELAITAASRQVDHITDRRFWLDDLGDDDDDFQVRYFTADASGLVWVDDLVQVDELATDADIARTFTSVWTAGTDYLLEPANAVADGLPYTAIRLSPGSSLLFPSYRGAVRVTGQFGWPAVPDEVKLATKMIASRLVKRAREAPFGVAGVGFDGAAVRIVSQDPDVLALLEPLRRRVYVG